MKRIHFIGIGGIGMSGIAGILLKKGYAVSGSDIKDSLLIDKLRSEGARIFIGHAAGNISGAEAVVYSSVIKEDNPEFACARQSNIALIPRAKMLAEVMKDYTVITVSGSHGKTTTSSMLAHLLQRADLSPTLAVGGIVMNLKDNFACGKGSFFVAEADESDGSFLFYSPKFSIVTNVDYEHMDYYKNEDNLFSAFAGFINKTAKGGRVFACADDANLRRIINSCAVARSFYGLNEGADILAYDVILNGFYSQFSCRAGDVELGGFYLPLAGIHNVSNALAVIGTGLQIGIPLDVIKESFSSFKGVKRRFQVRAKLDTEQILVVEDYGHHPTEIKRTLEAAKSCGYSRLVCVFQPHRYTRTQLLMDEFSRCFDAADLVFITDIYAAGEPEIQGINALALCSAVRKIIGDKAEYIPKPDIPDKVISILKSGDFLIMMGAGDITRVCDLVAQRLEGKAGADTITMVSKE